MSKHDDFLDDYIGYRIFEDSMKGSGGGKLPRKNTGCGCGCGTWVIMICIVVFVLGIFGSCSKSSSSLYSSSYHSYGISYSSHGKSSYSSSSKSYSSASSGSKPASSNNSKSLSSSKYKSSYPKRNLPIPTTPNPMLIRTISITTTVMTSGTMRMRRSIGINNSTNKVNVQ